jgi:hypothetical protein
MACPIGPRSLGMDPTENTASNSSPIVAWRHCSRGEVFVGLSPGNWWCIWWRGVTSIVVHVNAAVETWPGIRGNVLQSYYLATAASVNFIIPALSRHVTIFLRWISCLKWLLDYNILIYWIYLVSISFANFYFVYSLFFGFVCMSAPPFTVIRSPLRHCRFSLLLPVYGLCREYWNITRSSRGTK